MEEHLAANYREQESQQTRTQAQNHTFRQHIAKDLGCARAESHPHRQFTRASAHAGQHQNRYVGTRNQQHEHDYAKCKHQRLFRIANQSLLQRHHHGARTIVRARILCSQLSCYAIHVGARLIQRYARAQPAHNSQKMLIAPQHAIGANLLPQRNPEFGFFVAWRAETARHDADYIKWFAIQRDRSTHDLWIAAKLSRPEVVA